MRLDLLDSAAAEPWLVGVGYGLGNMLHAGPMIRAIARHIGRPVDLVVAGDKAECRFLLQRQDCVASVFSLDTEFLRRRYATVYLSHFFLPFKLSFNAPRVMWSRDWRQFKPGRTAHETRFNLEAASALLGIPWSEEDLTAHYIADLTYDWPAGDLVGLHAGSKTGYWATKRWPHFERLAGVLMSRGFRVASFGLAEEYVAGTENRTGGSVADMAGAMRACSYFIANDSGVMNMANALEIPLLALFGPTDPGTRGPASSVALSVAVERDCVPCEIRDPAGFRAGRCQCLAHLPVERVLDAFDNLIDLAEVHFAKRMASGVLSE